MFTGIIKETGKIKEIKKGPKATIFSIQTKSILKNKKIGGSIAVDGICVTIIKIDNNIFDFDAMPETLGITTLGTAKIGNTLNLEPALTLNQALDGHLIQGHIDEVGTIDSLIKEKDKVQLKISHTKEISQFLAFKGSVTINGVSLTISDLDEKTFSVDLIPHTLKLTNLNDLKKGDKVNIEIDMIARYLKNLLDSREKETKYEFLKERGFL